MSAARDCGQAIIEEGALGAGAQLVVRQHGRAVLNEHFGTARPAFPMAQDTIQSLYCLTKPVVACAVCATADRVGISLDSDMRDASPRLAVLLGEHRVSLRDVLSHRAGLHTMSALEAMFMPPEPRRVAAERATFADDWRIGIDRAYSDYQGWNALRVWLEDMTDRSFGAAIRETMLAPLGLDDIYFGVTDEQWLGVRDRLGVNFQLDNGAALPLPHTLLRKFLDDPLMQVVGGYASASGIARFYEATLDVLAGRTRAGLPNTTRMREMLQPTGERASDALCNTPVAFGLGFMVDLEETFGASIGPAAFGHLGLRGNVFVFADPELDIVAVFASNTVFFSNDEKRGVGKMRRSLVDAIYSDLKVAA